MSTPYVAFQEQNYTISKAVKKIPAGTIMWQILDNTNPTNIKTYLLYQMLAGTILNPQPPSGWSFSKVEYAHDIELTFDLSSSVKYIITNQNAVFIEIN